LEEGFSLFCFVFVLLGVRVGGDRLAGCIYFRDFFFFSFKPVNLELEKNIGLC
jgi:hypothetical protein